MSNPGDIPGGEGDIVGIIVPDVFMQTYVTAATGVQMCVVRGVVGVADGCLGLGVGCFEKLVGVDVGSKHWEYVMGEGIRTRCFWSR